MKKTICLLLCVIMIALLFPLGGLKAEAEASADTVWQEYARAGALLLAGEYEKAAEAFAALGSFEDSEALAELANNRLLYAQAKELLDAGYYERAAQAFAALGSFEDSEERALEAENWQKYLQALALLDAREYEQAAEAFSALAPFEDSAAQAELAQARIELQEADEALEASEQDRAELKAQLETAQNNLSAYRYDLATDARDRGEYAKAAERFAELGDYKDSAALATDCAFLRDIPANFVDIRALEKAPAGGEQPALPDALSAALAALEAYEGAQFKDPELKEAALKLIHGLRDSLNGQSYEKDCSAAQLARQSGLVALSEALGALNTGFGLFSEDAALLDAYLGPLAKEQERLQALQEIEADLQAQLGTAEPDPAAGSYLPLQYMNNTEYRIDLTVRCVFVGADGTALGESENVYTYLQPGRNTTLNIYQPVKEWDHLELSWLITRIVTRAEQQQEWAYWAAQQEAEQNSQPAEETRMALPLPKLP